MSFVHLLRAEWTKFRTVPSWLIGAVVAILVLILIGLVSALGSHAVAAGPGGRPRQVLLGPDGRPVQDDFTFVHRTLTGDGTLTVRVPALTGGETGLEQWAKAGLMIKANTQPGSPYVAVMRTGAHGARMQYDFSGDIAGPASAQWLRLTRAGSHFTGYASSDGSTWTRIGTVTVAGIPATASAGMFVTSPPVEVYEQHFGSAEGNMYPTQATATFDDLTVAGALGADDWQGGPLADTPGQVTRTSDAFTVSGAGNIAPNHPDGNNAVERTLVGTFAGLTVLVVLGVLFVTSEYRRGMIRTTFAASPGRVRVLAAKAVVVGAVGFVAGAIGSAIALPLCRHVLIRNGNLVFAVTTGTEVRLILGTAAAIAVASVLALAIGTLLRRSVGAVAAVIVLIVLPYLLSTAAVVPADAARWLLRLTPAATFAVQQSVTAYHQVEGVYTPALGFYPLSPWSGFAVLCLYAAVAFGLAAVVVRRRDA